MIIVRGAAMGFAGVPYLPVKFNLFAPWGEAFWVPYFHYQHGATWNLLFEAKAGGAMDRFGGAKSAEETLQIGKQVIRELIPWDYAWAKDMEVADPHGWLIGGVAPTVRSPVGRLPSGRVVTPLGDTAVSLDPIGGQGANSGNKMAKNLVEQIVAHDDRAFDAAWMTATFERYWARHGAPTVRFNNLLLEPIPSPAKQILIAQYGSNGVRADVRQKIADAFACNFEDPALHTDVMDDGKKAHGFIADQAGGGWLWPVVSGAAGVGREQLRQAFGGQPRHPLVDGAGPKLLG